MKEAIRRLGVSDRDAAAALIREWDLRDSQALASQPPGLEPIESRDINAAHYHPELEGRVEDRVRETQLSYRTSPDQMTWHGAGSGSGAAHGTRLQTITRIVALIVGFVIIASAAQPLAEGFDTVARFIISHRNN